jgi:hypothetical protein
MSGSAEAPQQPQALVSQVDPDDLTLVPGST